MKHACTAACPSADRAICLRNEQNFDALHSLMAEVSTTLCRIGPSAVAVAHGPTLDSVVITIQSDGALHYCTSLRVWTLQAETDISAVANFLDECCFGNVRERHMILCLKKILKGPSQYCSEQLTAI